MMHADHRWLVGAALAGVLALSVLAPGRASDGPSSSGEPENAESSGPLPMIVLPVDELPRPSAVETPAAYVLPPLPNYTGVVDEHWASPLLDRPEAAPPGVFFNAESSVVWVHLRNELVGGFAPNFSVGMPPSGGMPITGDLVSFPGNPLNATVTPRFELGYRFPDGFGELRLSYRFLDTRGSDTLVVPGLGPASQKGRLDVNFIDLDFGTRQFCLGRLWEMRTAVGLRYATAFFDSQVSFLRPTTVQESPFGIAPFTRLSQSEAVGNRYIGAHSVWELGRKLPVPGLTLFGRLEGAGMYGRVHQTFKETFVEAPGFTQTRVTNGVGTPLLATQVGFSYDVPQWNHCRFLIGYQFEMWWQFGRGNNDLSFGTLDDQGLFLRAELTF
jgi:hypothetical protein